MQGRSILGLMIPLFEKTLNQHFPHFEEVIFWKAPRRRRDIRAVQQRRRRGSKERDSEKDRGHSPTAMFLLDP